MYCLKCKKHTNTVNKYISITKNGRRILKGICKICGKIKNCFLPNSETSNDIKVGKSVLNKALNVLPLPEMHLKSAVGSEKVSNGSFSDTGKYSYCGPFTKLRKRLSQGYKGINSLDKACLKHDIAYATHADTPSRNYYDDVLSAEASKIALDDDTPKYEKKDAKTVNAIMATKSRFGL